jgi:phospholipase/carboxylesterase
MHRKQIVEGGTPLTANSKVLILLHGRGANAEDILGLAQHLEVKDFSLIAPQATNNTWYPYSFLAPPSQNEPWLSSALDIVKEIVDDILAKGVPTHHIYFAGFSQGACLMLEFITRHAKKYGGAAAFTGGLIGDKIYATNYSGDFNGMPLFIGSSDPDPHVPVERVTASVEVLEKMNAKVVKKIYAGMGHTIVADEIESANRLIFSER